MAYDFSKAAELTNKELSDELSKLTPLKSEEINSLFRNKIDKKRFNKILEIVDSSASQHRQFLDLKDNFEELGGIVIKLLKKYLL